MVLHTPNFNSNQGERGVVLIVTFFIMIIVLLVTLFLSGLLYNEIRIGRNIVFSVIAYYSADSGVEKFFYYDRKILPEIDGMRVERGLCVLGEKDLNPKACLPDPNPGGKGEEKSIYCNNWEKSTQDPAGEGCDPMICNNCQIKFNSDLDETRYSIIATVFPAQEQEATPSLTLYSKGKFHNVVRQIEVKSTFQKGEGVIRIDLACVRPRSVPQGAPIEILVNAHSQIVGITINSVKAIIKKRVEGQMAIIQTIELEKKEGDQWSAFWTPQEIGLYFVDIKVVDSRNNERIESISYCQE